MPTKYGCHGNIISRPISYYTKFSQISEAKTMQSRSFFIHSELSRVSCSLQQNAIYIPSIAKSEQLLIKRTCRDFSFFSHFEI